MEAKALSERLPEELFSEIHQAIGHASVCWKEGVFDAEQASKVAFNLCHLVADEFERSHQIGIKEAVEWSQRHWSGRMLFETKAGQAKLKEWGIGG